MSGDLVVVSRIELERLQADVEAFKRFLNDNEAIAEKIQKVVPAIQSEIKDMCAKCAEARRSYIERSFRELLTDCMSRERSDDQATGHVYFIASASGGPVKIGFSRDVRSRLKDLQRSSPERLKILGVISGTFETEKSFHNRFDALRLHGEWFEPDDWLMDFIQSKTTTLTKKGGNTRCQTK